MSVTRMARSKAVAKERECFLSLVSVAATSFSSLWHSRRCTYLSKLALLVSYVMVFFAFDGWLESPAQIERVLKLCWFPSIGLALFGLLQAIVGGYSELYFRLYPVMEETIARGRGHYLPTLPGKYRWRATEFGDSFAIALRCPAKNRPFRLLGITCTLTSIFAELLTQSRGGYWHWPGILLLAVLVSGARASPPASSYLRRRSCVHAASGPAHKPGQRFPRYS